MTCIGTLLLTSGQLRRIFAETVSPITCMFASAPTRAMLIFVEGPSSKMPSAYCQNRYPSPSKRSGLSRVRPHSFYRVARVAENVIAPSAKCGQMAKKAFAPTLGTSETVAAKQFRLREGSLTCSRKPGLSPLSQWLGLPPAWTTTQSAGLPVPLAAQLSPMQWAAMLLSALSSVVARASSATTSASATKTDLTRATARFKRHQKAIGARAPVVFFVLPTCGPMTAKLT